MLQNQASNQSIPAMMGFSRDSGELSSVREGMKTGSSTIARILARQRNLEPERAQSKSTTASVTALLFSTARAALPGVGKHSSKKQREPSTLFHTLTLQREGQKWFSIQGLKVCPQLAQLLWVSVIGMAHVVVRIYISLQ